MKIIVDQSPVGVGKTYRAIEMMTAIRGRYVFATERMKGMDEVASDVFAAALRHKNLPMIEKIHSDNGRHGTVARQIADLPRSAEGHDHVIALVSHEGLMSSDFDGFEGWTLIVDEVPSMFVMHTYKTPTDTAFFEQNYTLTAIESVAGQSWNMVGLTEAGAALSSASIADCEGHRYLHHFHRRCRDPRMGPVVNLSEWSQMAEPHREWVWWSLFHPDQIASFTNRYFLGNGFTKSLSFKLFNDARIEWQTMSHMGDRPLVHRHARVVFYSERPTSLSYFSSEDGQADLTKIAAEIERTTTEPFFWSCNGAVKATLEKHLAPESYKRPRQAGTSRLMDHHCAAMFYAAKPSRDIDLAIRGLGSEAADWVATNEYETVLQFVTRTSVRDVSSAQDVVLHVFNRDQANYLKTFFDSQPHITTTLEKIDLGLSTQTKKTTGRKVAILTDAQREAKQIAKRERNKLAMRERRKAVA